MKKRKSLVRSLALEQLADLRPWPHLDKEELFSTFVEFYQWFLRHIHKKQDMQVYVDEFLAHHRTVMDGLAPALLEAAFITWFVENGFHELPLLGWADLSGETTRFSSPSFRLPTNDPDNTFLIQWLIWHLNLPQNSTERHATEATRRIWAVDLAADLPASCKVDRKQLMESAERFFHWCQEHIRTWDAIFNALRQFSYLYVRQMDEEAREWDARFIIWFSEMITEQALDKLSDEDAS